MKLKGKTKMDKDNTIDEPISEEAKEKIEEVEETIDDIVIDDINDTQETNTKELIEDDQINENVDNEKSVAVVEKQNNSDNTYNYGKITLVLGGIIFFFIGIGRCLAFGPLYSPVGILEIVAGVLIFLFIICFLKDSDYQKSSKHA